MEGLLIWSIEGLKRVLKQGRFSKAETLESMGETYESTAHRIYKWLESIVEFENTDTFVATDEIYKRYCAWCSENSYSRETKIAFSRKLFGYMQRIGARKSRTEAERGYKNARFI